MRSLTIFLLILSSALLFTSGARAHQLSTAYLTATLNDTGVLQGDWQVRLYDLERALGIDANGDGKLLWGELMANRATVEKYLSNHLTLTRNTVPCSFVLDSVWQITEHYNEGYLALSLRAQCALEGELDLGYSAFFAEDSNHKLLLTIRSDSENPDINSVYTNRVLSTDQRVVTFNGDAGNLWLSAREFIVQGVIHIWKGLDHILFLLSLLLTCVLMRVRNRWVGRQSIRDIVITTTWIVTAFTLAHSITLTATALGWINFSSRWVEVGIAASVALASLNNIFPVVLRLGWLTFVFGLLHGMGFAGVLGELGVPADQKLLTVLSFNLGVEIGQMVIVAAVLPLLILVRNSIWYSRYSVIGVSVVICLVALQWIFERL